MQRQQAKNVVPANRKPSAIAPAKAKPVPLDTDSLKQVVGGAASTQMPNKGW
jgi:hypothetical protein